MNFLLAAGKFAAGLIAHSSAMLSDAVHTLSDVLSTVVVIAGIKMGNRQPDKDHPYGHERLECLAALLLATMLFLTGVGIGWNGLQQILRSGVQHQALQTPGLLALVAAVVSIVVKEALYWITRAAAKRTGSGSLMADAWHHRSDALSSIGSFVGILGAKLGLPILDPIACLLISVLILKVSIEIARDAVAKLTDRACDDATVTALREHILGHDDVLSIDQIRTRLFGDRYFLDVEISCIATLSLAQAHEIAEEVHDQIETTFPKVKHCMIHVNPKELE